MSAKLAIKPERDTYSPGEQVNGTVEVLEATNGRQLTVALEYRDWTNDYRTIMRSISPGAPLRTGDLEAGASFAFGLVLPADALPNQTGKLGATGWGLHAQVEKFGPDVHCWHLLSVPATARVRAS
jgi:hypothetical protein